MDPAWLDPLGDRFLTDMLLLAWNGALLVLNRERPRRDDDSDEGDNQRRPKRKHKKSVGGNDPRPRRVGIGIYSNEKPSIQAPAT